MFDPFDGEIAFLSSYNRWLIYPGLRHPFFTYTLIPLNQTPQAFTLIMEGSNSVYEFDLDDSVVKKTVPFDEPPSNFPELGHDPIISYSEVDLFRVTYSDFYFRENLYHDGHVTLEYNVEVENLGGYDLRDSENHIHPPTLIAMDNHGRYYTGGLAFIYDVPPGYVKQGQGMALVLGRPHKDFDWIWLGLFEPGSQRPLGQMTLPAPSPSEIREAPF